MSTGLSMSALCIGDVSKCLGWEGQKHLEEQVVDHTAPLQRHGVVNGRAEEERCAERAEGCLGKQPIAAEQPGAGDTAQGVLEGLA
jgi:hypothetical protein